MRILISLLLGIVGLTASAKTPQFVLRANVIDGDTAGWKPLENVFISFSSTTSTEPVKYKLLTGNDSTKITDDSGEIRLLVDGGQGKYMLSIDKDGFDPVMKPVEVKFRNQNVVWLGNISMRRTKLTELEEVEVKATAIKLVVKGDTMVYNADAFKLADGSMLDALIKQLDGVELDSDGQITVNGRKVNSLLLNGKDFFKGDPSVALENLPAYAVKNLKVYDKAAEDDYLTKSSNKLARKENEENLVIDVSLKKEINMTGMGSIEGGYGTEDRWLGKAFGMGNTDKLRFAGYVNANNVKDTETGGSGRGWSRGGNGLSTRELGGLDYYYKNEKTEVRGEVNYSRVDQTTRKETASTNYYHSGDIYSRSTSNSGSIAQNLSTEHELKQKWASVYMGAKAKLNWSKNDSHSINRNATFDEQPDETTRTEALDSVYARPFSKKYNDIMLNRLATTSRGGTSSLGTNGNVDATIRTTEMQGRVRVGANGGYSKNNNDGRTLYLQRYGGANHDPNAVPTNSDRYSDSRGSSYNFGAYSTYDRDWTTITNEAWQHRFSMTTNISASHSRSNSTYDLFTAEPTSDEIVLPSLTSPENALQDLADSYHSKRDDNYADARLTLNYNREPIAPSKSGFNPAFYMGGSVAYWLKNEKLNYHVLEYTDPENLNRTKGHFNGWAFMGMNSGNDNRYLNLGFNYNYNISDPSLNLYLKNRTNTNPLHIYINNADGLRSSTSHNASFSFSRYGRIVHNNLRGNVSWSKNNNTIGNWNQYNPQTGVTTSRPMNINGNWDTNGNVSYSHPFGKREQFTPSAYVSGSYQRSVDFQSTTDVPLKSVVNNRNLTGRLNFNYKFPNGSNFTIGGGTNWQYATSARENFNKVDAMTYSARADVHIELPANMQFRTDLDFQARRGYQEAAMNTNQWLWNATLSKSIMNGALTFKVRAVDILGQIDPIRLTVNAQGRTETWTNTLPRYVMFSVLWKVNSGFGKAKGKGNGGREPGGFHGPRGGGGGRMMRF